MKPLVILACVVVLALCQTSTNPTGDPFFAPSLVRELPLNSTISSVMKNTTEYTEFYYVWVPDNVGIVVYSLNSTDSECEGTIGVYIVVGSPLVDESTGFSCYPYGTNDLYCYKYDARFYIDGGNVDEYNLFIPNFRTGQYQYLSLSVDYYGDQKDCSYSLGVRTEFECPPNTVVYSEGEYPSCVAAPTNVTASQTVSGNLTSSEQTDYYCLNVPQNTSQIWGVVSSKSILRVSLAGGFASNTQYSADYSTSSYSSYNETTDLYYYYVTIYEPMGNYPWYFAVSNGQTPYNFTAYQSYCGSSNAGIGEIQYPYVSDTGNVQFIVPNCAEPVVYTNLNVLSGSNTFAFNLPAYNISVGYPGSEYATFYVPVGTVGAINLTCNSTINADIYFTFLHGTLADCYLEIPYFYCNSEGEQVTILSQDLWVGGYWSLAACNYESTLANVTLIVSGSVTVPPSPSPSTGASPSPGSDSSSSSLVPALLLVALVLIAIIL